MLSKLHSVLERSIGGKAAAAVSKKLLLYLYILALYRLFVKSIRKESTQSALQKGYFERSKAHFPLAL